MKGVLTMKLLLKIAAWPITLALSIFTTLSAAVLSCAASIFALAGSLLMILALAVLLSGSVKNAAILAVIAFLVSPLGIPMLIVRMLGGLQDLNLSLKGFIRG